MRLHFPIMLLGCLPMALSSQLSAQEPKLRDTLTGHADSVWSVAFSPDGKTLASGSRDETIRLWDVKTGKERATLVVEPVDVYTGAVWSMAYSPDGETLATISEDKTVRLWDVKTGKERATLKLPTEQEWSLGFSPDGKTLATNGKDVTVRLWDVKTGKERAILEGHTTRV
jgi:WD40 repeat protein